MNAYLDDGVDINCQDEHGNSLLHIACQNGHDSLIKLLVVFNIDIDRQNYCGQTALHFAKARARRRTRARRTRRGRNERARPPPSPPFPQMYGYDRIYNYLSSRGANPAIQNNEGVAARDAQEPSVANIKSSPPKAQDPGRAPKLRRHSTSRVMSRDYGGEYEA